MTQTCYNRTFPFQVLNIIAHLCCLHHFCIERYKSCTVYVEIFKELLMRQKINTNVTQVRCSHLYRCTCSRSIVTYATLNLWMRLLRFLSTAFYLTVSTQPWDSQSHRRYLPHTSVSLTVDRLLYIHHVRGNLVCTAEGILRVRVGVCLS